MFASFDVTFVMAVLVGFCFSSNNLSFKIFSGQVQFPQRSMLKVQKQQFEVITNDHCRSQLEKNNDIKDFFRV